MLLQEEQHIIRWLTQYGALAKTQVIRLLKDLPPAKAERIIRRLNPCHTHGNPSQNRRGRLEIPSFLRK